MSALNIVMVADTGELEEFYRDVQDFPEDVLNNIRASKRSYTEELTRMAKRRLSVYPPAWRSKQRYFRWSRDPEEQRRAQLRWMDILGVDKLDSSKSYRRTGKTGKAWEAVTAFEPKADGMWIDVTIQNLSEGASYVYGDIRKNWQRVPSHEVTGWLSAKSSPEMNATIEDVFNITLDTIDNIAERLDL